MIKNDKDDWNSFIQQLENYYELHFGSISQVYDFHEASNVSDYYPKNTTLGNIEKTKLIQNAIMEDTYPTIKGFPLPKATPIDLSLSQVIMDRRSCRDCMNARPITLQHLSNLLYYSYGIQPNGMRNTPSGGALYPIEIYAYCVNVNTIEKDLYYYSPIDHSLKKVPKGKSEIEDCFVNPKIYQLVENAAVYIFITAKFLKNFWKYGNRGYRFVLIEAGHVAQNINLVSTSLEMASLNIGGFFDDDTNELLMLDGVYDAMLYMICVGYT